MTSNTELVNVKVKFIRPEFNHLEEWMNHPDHVYIGRNGRVFIGSKENRRICCRKSPDPNLREHS